MACRFICDNCGREEEAWPRGLNDYRCPGDWEWLEIRGQRYDVCSEVCRGKLERQAGYGLAKGADSHCLDCNGTGQEQIPCGADDTRCEFCEGVGRYAADYDGR